MFFAISVADPGVGTAGTCSPPPLHINKVQTRIKKKILLYLQLLSKQCWLTLHTVQGAHGIEEPGKVREFVLVFFPGLEVWNFVENLEISRKVGKS